MLPACSATIRTGGLGPTAVGLSAFVGLACQTEPDRPAPSPAPIASTTRSSTTAPPPEAPGGNTLTGKVQVFESAASVPAGLCVSLVDPEPRAFGDDALTLASTTADAAGLFTFSDLPVPPSIGWVVVVDACGDTTTWVPTGTPLPGEQVGGRGAGDTVDVDAWLVSTSTRDAIDDGLSASGSRSFLGEGGGLIGHSLAADGTPHHESWVRGPNATQLWYARADGSYVLYENTDEATGGLYVAPDAEDVYGVWVTRVAGEQFQPLMAGGLPGVLLVWDFYSWTPRTAAGL